MTWQLKSLISLQNIYEYFFAEFAIAKTIKSHGGYVFLKSFPLIRINAVKISSPSDVALLSQCRRLRLVDIRGVIGIRNSVWQCLPAFQNARAVYLSNTDVAEGFVYELLKNRSLIFLELGGLQFERSKKELLSLNPNCKIEYCD